MRFTAVDRPSPERMRKNPGQPPLAMAMGQIAEEKACVYLQRQGLHLVTRNYRCRAGEIDLVMRDADTLVFVEVRWRRSAAFGSALESVGPRKQSRMVVCAMHYLQRHPENLVRPSRFDVVGVCPGVGDEYAFEWVRDAIRLESGRWT